MDRRTFVSAAVGALIASAAPDAHGAPRTVQHGAVVLDGRWAPPLHDLANALARSAGPSAVKATIGGAGDDFETTLRALAVHDDACAIHADHVVRIRSIADLAAAERTGRLGLIYALEGVAMLDAKVERIGSFRDLGVRVMQLTCNQVSPFGAGAFAPPEAGLTELGRAAIASMNQAGIAIDLSCANAATSDSAIAASTKPVLMAQSGCAAIHAHPRNRTDAQLRALADKGGVFGLYDLQYLTLSPRRPTLDEYMAHMLHALNVCGEDHVGLGAHAAFEGSPQSIADALTKRGKSSRVAEKVLGGNFVRAFADIW